MFEFWNYTPYWMYGNVHGRCFDCNGIEFGLSGWIYAKISFDRFATAGDGGTAASLTPFDMRTLKDIEEGCCPPLLMAHLLETGG